VRAGYLVNVNSKKCLDVTDAVIQNGANVQQFSYHGGSNQRWRLEPLGVGPVQPVTSSALPYYAIVAEHSGKCLDVAGGSTVDGANVQQFTPHYGPNQQWTLVPVGQEYLIVNRHSGKCLDVVGGSKADGANVQQFTNHGGPNQRWIFRR
jgi:hypothetical protein